MKGAKALFLFVFLTSFAAFADERSFYTVSEYMLKSPEQAWKFDNFANIVRSEPVPLKSVNTTPVKIAVVYPALQSSDYWRRSERALKKRMSELNINYTLLTYHSKPSGDTRLQVSQLAQAASAGADFIIVSADSPQMRSAVGRLLFEGRHKIIIQNLTTPLKEWERRRPLLYTGFDHISGSAVLADSAASMAGQNASYAVLNCSEGEVGYLRTKGFEERLAERGEYAKKSEYITDFNLEKARAATREIIKKYPDINFIFACSTDIALGAAEALKDSGAENVILNGWGGGEAELRLIERGELDFTVMRMNDDSSIAAAEAVKLVISGMEKEVPVIFSGDFSLITASDSAEKIKELKKKAFRYSGENE